MFGYRFRDKNRKAMPYWRDVGTLDAYYQANMDLIEVDPVLNLYDREWPIRTHQPQLPPPKFVFRDEGRRRRGRRGEAHDSMVCQGCIVSGGHVRRSILSPNVRVNSLRHRGEFDPVRAAWTSAVIAAFAAPSSTRTSKSRRHHHRLRPASTTANAASRSPSRASWSSPRPNCRRRSREWRAPPYNTFMSALKNRRWIWVFVVFFGLAIVATVILIAYNLGQQLKPEQLAAARQLWNEKGPRSYTMAYTVRRNESEDLDHYVVKVVNRRVVASEFNGRPEEPGRFGYRGMDSLFDDIERFQTQDREPGKPRVFVRAIFDPKDGCCAGMSAASWARASAWR